VHVHTHLTNMALAIPFATSVISVPKSDLKPTAGLPSVDHATIRSLLDVNVQSNPTLFMQPVIDFGASDGREAMIDSGFRRSDIQDPAGPSQATLGNRTWITDNDFYPDPPAAPQLGTSQTIDTGINANRASVYKQGNFMWMTYGIELNGRAAVRWVKVNATTNDVEDSGTIGDSVLSL
jgi:hypothetical protein